MNVPQNGITTYVSEWMPTNKYEVKLGDTQIETIPFDRVWTEYETVEKIEYVPRQRIEYEEVIR